MLRHRNINFKSARTLKKGYPSPDAVGAAIFIVAKYGGYLARKSDPPPGDQILWRGYSTLQSMCRGFELSMELFHGNS
ncbi:MAG: hypothetical protein KAR40_04525 [Candidatus Sabulitectum sp.]|nr:hypothetical protein [Candidatus Sabulitectum sp.]